MDIQTNPIHQGIIGLIKSSGYLLSDRIVVAPLPPNCAPDQMIALFEPLNNLAVMQKEQVCAELKQKILATVGVHCLVVVVPHNWLVSHSSAEAARQENVEKFLRHRDQVIHVVGDSQVRTLWTEDRSYVNTLKRIQAHWFGVFWSGDLDKFAPKIREVITHMKPCDVLAFATGEPEARVIIPGAPDPLAMIETCVARYENYFQSLQREFGVRLGFISGPPTNATETDYSPVDLATGEGPPGSFWKPARLDPARRYHFQRLYFEALKSMCDRLDIPFIDVFTPFLGPDGYVRAEELRDGAHLLRKHKWTYFNWLDQTFGFVTTEPNVPPMSIKEWDGSYEHYMQIMGEVVLSLTQSQKADFENLVSSGTIDSLAFIQLVATLETVFKVQVDLNTEITRERLESLSGIYNHFIAPTAV